MVSQLVKKVAIAAASGPKALGAYSPAILVESKKTLFVSGQLGLQVTSLHCTMCTYIGQFFPFRPRAVGHIVQPRDCHIIEHIFVPTHSVERNNEKIRFP